MKNKAKEKTTTIALTINDNERLTKRCKALSIQKKEFIPIILDYIENNGLNPKTDHAPKTELVQIKKRIDQYFGFIKTQEKEFLRPMLEAIQGTENRLQKQIKQILKKDDLKNFKSEKEEMDMAIANKLLNAILENILKDEPTYEFRENVNEQLDDTIKKNHLRNFQEEVINRLERIEKKRKFF